MKNWLLPMAVLGVSGVGLLCASNRGRAQLRAFFDNLATSDDLFREFNQAVENELEYIQQTLDQLSKTLEISRTR